MLINQYAADAIGYSGVEEKPVTGTLLKSLDLHFIKNNDEVTVQTRSEGLRG